jgi:hypothetical protein
MLLISNVAHEDTDLAVVDFAPMATPLAFDPANLAIITVPPVRK